MVNVMRSAVGTAIAIASSNLLAQAVVKAEQVELQPQLRRDADGFSSCGVRVIAMTTTGTGAEAYDFSIMVGLDSYGTMKAGKYRTRLVQSGAEYAPVKGAVTPGPVNFWIAKELEGKPLLPLKTMPSTTPGFILALVDGPQAVQKIVAISFGERLQFATRYKAQPVDIVISFAGVMSNEERAPIFACIEGLVARWRASITDDAGK